MRSAGKSLLIAMCLCLLIACETDGNNPGNQSISVCFNIGLPDGWQHVKTYPLDTNGDNVQESVILYRFDVPSETGPHGGPIRAFVYQTDDRKPPNILAYELFTPDHDYLCECECTLAMEEVLSGLGGSELVVRDQCSGERSRLTIFYWDSDYMSRGHFHGHEIGVAPNKVVVEERLLDRAQLARREIYRSLDGTTYYRLDDPTTLIPYDRAEIIFCHGEPQDVALSPYPEKVVLSLYNHYTDTARIQPYFTTTGWDQLGQCDTGRCGCSSMRFEVAHVWVTELQPGPEDTVPGSNQATVTATINCERQDGIWDGDRFIRWYLIRENGHWKLNDAQ